MSDVTPVERAQAKARERVGPCANPSCSYGCEGFAREKHQDGFDLCVCTHTQHSHKVPEEGVQPD